MAEPAPPAQAAPRDSGGQLRPPSRGPAGEDVPLSPAVGRSPPSLGVVTQRQQWLCDESPYKQHPAHASRFPQSKHVETAPHREATVLEVTAPSS